MIGVGMPLVGDIVQLVGKGEGFCLGFAQADVPQALLRGR